MQSPLLWLLFLFVGPTAMPMAADEPPPGVRTECPSEACGLNGTRITGLAANLTGDIRTITLASGEVITLQ